MDLEIRNHVAIVTGGARGIGSGIACALANEGARVAVWDRDEGAARDLVATIESAGGSASVIAEDLTRKSNVAHGVAEVVSRYGGIQILVNNAGYSVDASIVDMTEAQWEDALAINLKAVFLVTQAVVPTMIAARYGRIVNISSRSYLGGEPNKTNYSAAKGGVVSFTRALACELGRHDITVNSVAPGFTLTDRLQALPHFSEIEARSRRLRLIDRAGTPGDVARAVLYLAAAGTGYVTGETIHVTGGRFG